MTLLALVMITASDPLPSWTESPRKAAILAFVAKVTTAGPDFVPPAERVAVFDNDGTLWCEMPMYVQVVFAYDRIRTEKPLANGNGAIRAALAGNMAGMLTAGEHDVDLAFAATHAGKPLATFAPLVRDWLASTEHPRFHRPYTRCIYQPMLELIAYLRTHGFTPYVVSGGTADFMRPWATDAYGIPPENIVGTTFKTKYALEAGKPVILVEPAVDLCDDGPGKPLGIARRIGRVPVMAFGNSDGDYEMLQYTTRSPGPRFGLFVHHTDAEREYAYDRTSAVGKLDRGLAAAPKEGWHLCSMKTDWATIFPAK